MEGFPLFLLMLANKTHTSQARLGLLFASTCCADACGSRLAFSSSGHSMLNASIYKG